MTVPAGASNGTLSHAAANDTAARIVRRAEMEPTRRRPRHLVCVSISGAKDNTLMDLAGQEGQRGYAMAAVLIMISLLSIAMIALLPVWRHQSQREKEAELAFRGEHTRAPYICFARRTATSRRPTSMCSSRASTFARSTWTRSPAKSFSRFSVVSNRSSRAAPGRGGSPVPGGSAQGRGGAARTLRRESRSRQPDPDGHRIPARTRRRSHPYKRRQRLERRQVRASVERKAAPGW